MRVPAKRSKPARLRSASPREGIYQLLIVLADSDPPIWRRIQVPGAFTLKSLHQAVQRAMDWEDSHLHEFRIGGRRYEPASLEAAFFDSKSLDENRALLPDVLPSAGMQFRYIYDFGDNWVHEIKVEKILMPEKGISYPRCVEGELACPPEDSGGIYGFFEKLEILKDPGHPDHEDIRDWMGRFDPAHFNCEAVNRSLRSLS